MSLIFKNDFKDEDLIIKIEHLSKIFGNFKAVDDISFEVKKGEIFGFLGANGAGKTTAIKILCGISKASLGSGFVAGFDINTQSELIKQNIGYMSQKFSLFEDLKVWENIYFFGKIYKLREEEIFTKMKKLLEKLEFEDQKDEFVYNLPLGFKQKLAFCVANFHSPKIIFLDEPTGGVDPITRRQFWQLIHEAVSMGTCVFITTHYMDEAEYCDRLSIMVDGRINALGSPSELKTALGVSSMNEVFYEVAKSAKRGGA
ncbi:ABC transporter [Campylobacter sp. MIT 99-7217]|uniref:ABC transporter ATP-binding protein n=1 Tax=Campylobacter sp. MIT 99-7217 TaxID=535091 RepID=UPI001159319F|nr:ABC transporter ATP-binding protein [Campylobacter sp. MIT 99-7217]TQR31822.1 ABC transporter [Campylobacter sp. MIT 99-7217]